MLLEEFNFMIENKTFDINFINNRNLLDIKIIEEATRLKKSPKNDPDRPFDAIIQSVKQGKTLEFFFVEYSGGLFRFSKNIYHDLIIPSKDNLIVEVKAYSDPERQWDKTVKDLKYKTENKKWFDAKLFYMFGYDNGKYKFYRKTEL